MTVEQVEDVIKSLREAGYTDEMIAKAFVNLVVEEKIDIIQCDAMLSLIGYCIPEEVKKASKKTQIEIAKKTLEEW